MVGTVVVVVDTEVAADTEVVAVDTAVAVDTEVAAVDTGVVVVDIFVVYCWMSICCLVKLVLVLLISASSCCSKDRSPLGRLCSWG